MARTGAKAGSKARSNAGGNAGSFDEHWDVNEAECAERCLRWRECLAYEHSRPGAQSQYMKCVRASQMFHSDSTDPSAN